MDMFAAIASAAAAAGDSSDEPEETVAAVVDAANLASSVVADLVDSWVQAVADGVAAIRLQQEAQSRPLESNNLSLAIALARKHTYTPTN